MKLFEVTVSIPNSEDLTLVISAKDDQEFLQRLKEKGFTRDQVVRIIDASPKSQNSEDPPLPPGGPIDLIDV
jgi:hypothetical protein